MYKKMPYWAQFNKLQKIITAVSQKNGTHINYTSTSSRAQTKNIS